MYTAKITNKEAVGGATRFTVEFSNGETTVSETCIPQDENGFNHWIKSRIATFEGGDALKEKYADGVVVNTEEAIDVPVKTQAEIDKDAWFKDHSTWVFVKQNLIDTGILVGDEVYIKTLKAKVVNGFNPEYFNLA